MKVKLGEDPGRSIYRDTYAVSIDDAPFTTVTADPAVHEYVLGEGLADGNHVIRLVKRTEALVGIGAFNGFDFGSGQLLAPPTGMDRRILFIGDSITAGYGVLGAGPDCGFRSEDEDFLSTFAWKTAKNLNADPVAVAYSGKGVYRNIDPSDPETIVKAFRRNLPDESGSAANHQNFIPNAVVFSLGTNDFVAGVPDHDAFVGTYAALLGEVRQAYPGAHFVLALSPMLTDSWPDDQQNRTKARALLGDVVARRAGEGDSNTSLIEFDEDTEEGIGCDWHPGVTQHEAMAQKLTTHLRLKMAW